MAPRAGRGTQPRAAGGDLRADAAPRSGAGTRARIPCARRFQRDAIGPQRYTRGLDEDDEDEEHRRVPRRRAARPRRTGRRPGSSPSGSAGAQCAAGGGAGLRRPQEDPLAAGQPSMQPRAVIQLADRLMTSAGSRGRYDIVVQWRSVHIMQTVAMMMSDMGISDLSPPAGKGRSWTCVTAGRRSRAAAARRPASAGRGTTPATPSGSRGAARW